MADATMPKAQIYRLRDRTLVFPVTQVQIGMNVIGEDVIQVARDPSAAVLGAAVREALARYRTKWPEGSLLTPKRRMAALLSAGGVKSHKRFNEGAAHISVLMAPDHVELHRRRLDKGSWFPDGDPITVPAPLDDAALGEACLAALAPGA